MEFTTRTADAHCGPSNLTSVVTPEANRFTKTPTLLDFISRVFGVCSKEKMPRVDALPVIARMAHTHPGWVYAIVQCVSKSVCLYQQPPSSCPRYIVSDTRNAVPVAVQPPIVLLTVFQRFVSSWPHYLWS